MDHEDFLLNFIYLCGADGQDAKDDGQWGALRQSYHLNLIYVCLPLEQTDMMQKMNNKEVLDKDFHS